METRILLFLIWLMLCKECTAQEDKPPEERLVVSPSALGGMVQGMFHMQIRPEGGFYEERYAEIFKDAPLGPVKYESVLDTPAEDLVKKLDPKEAFSTDGKSLLRSLLNRGPNPCFERERIASNGLLGVFCYLQNRRVNITREFWILLLDEEL